jgi:myo-inositol 2-dehydrogenase/D-chiro-inositol 1-dehydrogenase
MSPESPAVSAPSAAPSPAAAGPEPTAADPVRMSVIGLGRLGRLHAENVAGRVPGARLVRVVDAVEDVARAQGERLGVEWSTDPADALGDDVEAVVIVAPTPLHPELIAQAAAAGKAIMCEKPIASDLAAGARAAAAADEAGVLLQIGFHRRFDPAWAHARERVRAGELGAVQLFRSQLWDQRAPAASFLADSGGLYLDVTVHDLDCARWMVGEVEEVTAHGAVLVDQEIAAVGDLEIGVVTLKFASGALGIIDNGRSAVYGYQASGEVLGTQGAVRIGDDHRVHDLQWRTPEGARTDWQGDFQTRFAPAYVAELEAFARAVRGGPATGATGADALAAQRLAAACERSRAERRTVAVAELEAEGA